MIRRIGYRSLRFGAMLAAVCCFLSASNLSGDEFRAGAAVIDITPSRVPVLVNGGMLSRSLSKVNTRLHARAVAMQSGATIVALVVVDSCMLPRPLLDEVKQIVEKQTGVPANRLLISATHSHTAPSCMACLGTEADADYVPWVKQRLVTVIAQALQAMQPAEVGFTKTDASEFTALRRWIRRPDRVALDPFGNPTVRANMHAAANWDDVTGPSGPEDPELSLIAIRARSGRPLALIANFSMHYFGDRDLSADYFGRFCERIQHRVTANPDFVAIMSHGCSGDIWRRDYALPPAERNDKISIDEYTDQLVARAWDAFSSMQYQSGVPLAMIERRLPMRYRVPDQQRLAWARNIVAALGDRSPKTREEVYAREQIILAERQQTEVVIQGLRIGQIAIATTPCETYALTGLRIKGASPSEQTIVIELANGGDGYIPPPEQHRLGGYNTWPARSAGLEITAEPRISAACIEILESLFGQPRRPLTSARGPAANALAQLDPVAWWRLDESQGPVAYDSSGHARAGYFEPGVVFFLEGPRSRDFCGVGSVNRAAMFAGGRLRTQLAQLTPPYAISLWFWNGMPDDARPISGWLVSRGSDHGLPPDSEHLGLAGQDHAGQLVFQIGDDSRSAVYGNSRVERWSWHHLLLVRQPDRVQVFLDGSPDLTVPRSERPPATPYPLFVGGRSDGHSNWEGRIDEVAIFDRAVAPERLARTKGPDN